MLVSNKKGRSGFIITIIIIIFYSSFDATKSLTNSEMIDEKYDNIDQGEIQSPEKKKMENTEDLDTFKKESIIIETNSPDNKRETIINAHQENSESENVQLDLAEYSLHVTENNEDSKPLLEKELVQTGEETKYSNENKGNIEFERNQIEEREQIDVKSDLSDIVSNTDDFSEEIKDDREADSGLKKQRYFPLLYTFGTLFNSFLAEFGEVTGNQDLGYNSSEKDNRNSSVLGDILNDTNITLNGSDSGKKTRFQCALRNLTEDMVFEVNIVNSTELLEILNFSKNQKLSPCVLVMFYAPWCYFCASTAPHYNALARVFPQLNILAVDTSHFSYLNARFGTVAVPNVMLFHSRSAVRFNHTTRDLDHFIQFVTNNTGLEPNKSVTVEPFDFEGPLSSKVVQKRDWFLWLAWTFVIVCSVYAFIGSLYGQAFIARVRILWQEHQHIE